MTVEFDLMTVFNFGDINSLIAPLHCREKLDDNEIFQGEMVPLLQKMQELNVTELIETATQHPNKLKGEYQAAIAAFQDFSQEVSVHSLKEFHANIVARCHEISGLAQKLLQLFNTINFPFNVYSQFEKFSTDRTTLIQNVYALHFIMEQVMINQQLEHSEHAVHYTLYNTLLHGFTDPKPVQNFVHDLFSKNKKNSDLTILFDSIRCSKEFTQFLNDNRSEILNRVAPLPSTQESK